MATVQETQDFLDEMAAPSIQTRAAVKSAAKPFQLAIGLLDQQAAIFRSLIMDSNIVEPAVAITQKYNEYDELLKGQKRLIQEMQDRLRSLVQGARRTIELEQEIRDLAEAEGYTV